MFEVDTDVKENYGEYLGTGNLNLDLLTCWVLELGSESSSKTGNKLRQVKPSLRPLGF